MAGGWARSTVSMDGTSKTLLAANNKRVAIEVQNKDGNDKIAFDPRGGDVSTYNGVVLYGGDSQFRDGSAIGIGVVTCIGTSGQTVVVWELTRET